MTTTAIPSCPWCTDRSEVITLEESDRWPFLCLACDLAFLGTQEEFDRCVHKRRQRREDAERRERGLPLGVVLASPVAALHSDAAEAEAWADRAHPADPEAWREDQP